MGCQRDGEVGNGTEKGWKGWERGVRGMESTGMEQREWRAQE